MRWVERSTLTFLEESNDELSEHHSRLFSVTLCVVRITLKSSCRLRADSATLRGPWPPVGPQAIRNIYKVCRWLRDRRNGVQH